METTPSPLRISLWWTCLATFAFLFLPSSISSQCDTEVSGVFTYCNAIGTPGTTGYFVAFRVLDTTGDTLNVVDLNGNNVTNRGKRVNDITTQNEPATVTVTPLMISGVGADTLEYWYFGPYANGTTFNIALVDPDMECDTIFIASGTYNCTDNSGISDPGACDNDVPLYFLDFSQTEFDYGGGGGGNENFDEIFLIMPRTRESVCCDLLPANQSCFEFIIRLADQDIGLAIDDVGSGSPGGEIYADTLNMFNCTGVSANTWPFTQSGGQSQDLPLCLLGGGGQEFIVLSCKSGGNVTGASIDALSNIFAPPVVTTEPCNAFLEVFNADTVMWLSPDDPNLDNLLSCTNDSIFCTFLYDEAIFGDITSCAGDTFTYIVGSLPADNECFNADTILYDTTYVIVYPVFTVAIDSTCNATGDSLILTANVSSAAAGCEYAFTWSTGDTTQTITVPFSSTEIFVSVTRADVAPELMECSIAVDSIVAEGGLMISCVNITDTLYSCISELPEPDTTLVVISGCTNVDPLIFVEDQSNGGAGCIGDTLIITRYYIVDIDGDTITTTADRDTCTQLLSFVDNIPPVITSGCPPDVTVSCASEVPPPAPGTLTATDNCGQTVVFTHLGDAVSGQTCTDRFIVTRTYQAADNCGNTATCTQLITVFDDTAPFVSCPANVTVECAAQVPAPNTALVTSTDNCGGGVTVVHSGDAIFGNTCPNSFGIIRTYTATDSCGNSATCTQIITVFDNIPPTVTCPPAITVECSGDVPAPDPSGVTASDNCAGTPTVTHLSDVTVSMTCANQFTISRTYLATDSCGNSSTCVQSIFVNDDTPPQITCPPDATLDCTAGADPATTGMATATDNCGGTPAIDFTDSGMTGLCPVTFTRTWTATDSCGNVASCVQFITIDDQVPPTITCPPDITLACGSVTDPISTGNATATDNCTSAPIVLPADVTASSGCPQEYIITRIWTATDFCGNTSTCIQTITVEDNTPPMITCPADITLQCADQVPPPSTTAPIAIDDCGIAVVGFLGDSVINQVCTNQYQIIRTYQATDQCGNAATCTQLITVNDDLPPVIACPPDMTVECTTQVPAPNPETVTASDNCDIALVGWLQDSISNAVCLNRYTISRIYQASDLCGNTATCVQTITVSDNTPPAIFCPDNTTITANDDSSPQNTGMPTASDNCEGVPTFTSSDVTIEDECPGDYMITRTWVATDECGNSASCIQIIVVEGLCNVDLALAKELDPGQGSVAGGEDVFFTITVTNEGIVPVGSIVIVDYIPDGFILNDPDWTPGTAGSTGQSASIELSIANGELAPGGLQPMQSVSVQITLQALPDITPGTYFNIAEIERVFDVEGNDISNNDADSDPDTDDTNDPADEDDHDPALICVLPAPVILGDEFVCSGDTATYSIENFVETNTYDWILSGGGIIIENNDSNIVVVWTEAPGGPFVISVTETVTAECFATGSLSVVIQGGEAIACLDHVNLSIDSECGTVVTSGMILTGEDAGNNNFTVYVIDMNGDTLPNATVTWMHLGQTFKVSVVSECNGQSCWGLLTVEDKLPPVISCVCPVGDTSDICEISCLEVDAFNSGIIPEDLRPSVADNCGGTTLTIVNVNLNFQTCSGGYVLVTWLATDAAGNTSTCQQQFNIVPLTLETLEFPADYFGDCSESSDPAVTGWPQVDGINLTNIPTLCNIIASYSDNVIGLCGGGIKIIRRWTVFDWCVPEVREFTQFIILADQTPPVLTCAADITVGTNVWFCYANVLVPLPFADDACSEIKSMHLFSPAGIVVTSGNNFFINELPIGTHVVEWTVYDECHNSNSCTMAITVVDNVPPVPSCQHHLIVSLTNDRPNGITLVPAEAFDDGSFDNCSPVTFRARRMDSCIDFDWTTGGGCVDDIPSGGTPDGFDFGTIHGPCVSFACCDVDAGPIMVELEVTDAAGNVNYCMVEVEVQDKLAPAIECPADVTVSCEFELEVVEGLFSDEQGNNDGTLDEDPLSEIFGNMFDAFRHDASVRGSIIINDPGNDVMIQPFNWGLEGWANDNCEVNLSVEVREFNDCSGETLPGDAPPGAVKLITRRFLAFDASGNPTPGTCVQRIWVVDFNPFYISDTTCANTDPFDGVIWPCDVTLNTCPESLTGTGEPVIFDDYCNIIGVSFNDQRFDFADGSCYKILREWTIIDWCQFDAATGAGIWSHTQIIKVLDAAGPALLDCPASPLELCVDDAGVTLPANNQILIGVSNPLASSCSVHLTMSQTVRELCSESVIYDVKLYPFNGSEFIYLKTSTVLQLDGNNEGEMTFNTQESTLQSISEDGLPYNAAACGDYHRLVWTVTDGCGNVSICDHLLRLEDCKDPSPVCLNGISTVIMPMEGEVTIWASDFNASSFDDCTPADQLIFSFSGDNYQPSMTFTCDNVPVFGEPIEVEIWAADGGADQNCNGVIEWSERNADFCITYIIITDNNNVCDEQGLVLEGEVMTEDIDAISNTVVKLTGSNGANPEYITSSDGKYTFSNVIPGMDYTIRPQRNDDHENGVSTLDLVRIQKHLLGKEAFTSPYQFIAADANNSSSVSAIDLIEIRKVILGIYEEFPANQSWRFVKKGSTMDPANPWPFEEEIVINGLTETNLTDFDFIGVKVGDVNKTAKANALQILPRGDRDVLQIDASLNGELKAGRFVEVKLEFPEIVSGFQWTLDMSGLRFVAAKSRDISLDESNYALFDNSITMSWNGEPSITKDQTMTLVLEFEVLGSGRLEDMLRLTNSITPTEAYSLTDEIMDVRLHVENQAKSKDFALYQNNPNPWNNHTVIGFDLPEDAPVTFTVYDVAGKVLKTLSGDYKAGSNMIMLSAKDLPVSGVVYYRLDSGHYSATKRMIIQ